VSKRLYIQTVGCQMNVLDSELVAAELIEAGYELVSTAAKADTILFNTCSVRQHAEDKIYSALGRVKPLKARRPEIIIGVLGCMAQKDQAAIFRRAAHVDVVVGPGQLSRLPAILEEAACQRGPRLEVELDRRKSPPTASGGSASGGSSFNPPRTAAARQSPGQAMVRVMLGCDKFCTYCIVPRVRGPEQSRPAAEIVAEVRRLVADGCLEVTLLGQTVNSYCDRSEGRTLRLSGLLERLHEIEGLRRLRFVTNHPRHVTGDLLEAVANLPKVSPYLHVPAQSGSSRILRRMKRGYTAEGYREMIERIRGAVPGAAITSDFIVGFCGETEEDFQLSVDLVRWARFKNSFIFKYSPRPWTRAIELYEDDVPEEVKRRRNNDLLAVQNAICLEDNMPLLGRRVEILVEGPSKSARKRPSDSGQPVQLTGRTVCDRIVVLDGPPELAGKLLEVEIEKADAFTLFGRIPAKPASGSEI
jgi:tRNA-2-methylthio-N6-dimethylallyladenosine synthase